MIYQFKWKPVTYIHLKLPLRQKSIMYKTISIATWRTTWQYYSDINTKGLWGHFYYNQQQQDGVICVCMKWKCEYMVWCEKHESSVSVTWMLGLIYIAMDNSDCRMQQCCPPFLWPWFLKYFFLYLIFP